MRFFIYFLFIFLSSCTFFSNDFEEKLGSEISLSPLNQAKKFKGIQTTMGSQNLLTFKNSSQILQVRALNDKPLKDEELMKIIQNKVILLSTLFENQSVPYTGEISKTSTCLSHNTKAPQISENAQQKKYEFSLMATENFVFGSCTEKLDIFRTQYLILLCKKLNKIYEIKLFYPKNEISDKLDFNCSTGDPL